MSNLNAKGCWIIGTDTGIGKTRVAQILQTWLPDVFAMKPISAGAEFFENQWKNEDAKLLQLVQPNRSLNQINPIVLRSACSPHIAAAKQKMHLTLDFLNQSTIDSIQQAHQIKPFKIALLEGVGGLSVPIANDLLLIDWIQQSGLPILLVVGLKLGCLNHALLTKELLNSQGINSIGWIASEIDREMPYQAENIQTLKEKLTMPYLGLSSYLKRFNPERSYASWHPMKLQEELNF